MYICIYVYIYISTRTYTHIHMNVYKCDTSASLSKNLQYVPFQSTYCHPEFSSAHRTTHRKLLDNFSHESGVTSLQDPFTSRPYKTPFYFYYCVLRRIPRGILFQIHVEYSPSSRLLVSAHCSLRQRVEDYISLVMSPHVRHVRDFSTDNNQRRGVFSPYWKNLFTYWY